MSLADDLLEQAWHLANREPRRPRQVSLRRAVSAAYYAIFHLLTTETAKNWKRRAERHTLARMFDHRPMEKVCTKKRDELNEYFKTNPRSSHQRDVRGHLRVIAATFVSIQQHRETADYDNSAKWTRTDTWQKIKSVEAAFSSWRVIRDEHEAQDFLVTLLLRPR